MIEDIKAKALKVVANLKLKALVIADKKIAEAKAYGLKQVVVIKAWLRSFI